ncbi:hypothetical protein AKJ40_04155 [candidate division MSBL1 archaeon SCGC-AAA259M10]|uniref:HTH cro/C1-type domain-containing protein n=1 Tax=candidate division MSBL1 archaeon SCGC-AAA259M10 TaxID=1698270 RepID=A0A133UXW9_9EURY|nr:hypothetical protein AKJ40_04155 [candidate division MSBL1 archaeon SCGC-AAA259M10]
MLPPYEYIKNEIKSKRKEANWTKKKLSEESGVPKDIIEMIESGAKGKEQKYHYLKKIDEALEEAEAVKKEEDEDR